MSVEEVQKALKAAGFDPGPIDGIMGPLTKAAIRSYQADKGMDVTGKIDDSLTSSFKKETKKGGKGVREFMETNFPSFVWALDHPEIGPILEQAAKEEWEQLRIQGALQGTDWWKNTSQTARQAKLLQENDPSEWKRQLQAKEQEIENIAQQMGLSLTSAQRKKIANDTITMGLNPQQLEKSIIANSNFSRIRLEQIEAGEIGGVIARIENNIDQINDQYLLRLDNSTKMKWIREVALGEKSEDAFLNFAQTMAVKQMPFLKDLIDSGLSPQEALQPYRNQIAERLEMAPTAIDFTDGRFQKVLRKRDDPNSLASSTELSENVREVFHDEWNRTSNAKQTATRAVQQIAGIFGRRAT